jgi:hypothetical protein
VRSMTHRRIRRGVVLLAFVAIFATEAPQARPLVPAERRYSPFLGDVPTCDDPAVLERIQSRFRDREAQFWSTGLEILGFDEIREIGYRSNGLDHIPRRYCTARAILVDRKIYPVTFNIVEDAGIIGIGFGVEWCLTGLDRLYAYAPHCKMARP